MARPEAAKNGDLVVNAVLLAALTAQIPFPSEKEKLEAMNRMIAEVLPEVITYLTKGKLALNSYFSIFPFF